jgi:hypothetical protein
MNISGQKRIDKMRKSPVFLAIVLALLIVACNLTRALTDNANTAIPPDHQGTEMAIRTPIDLPASEVASTLPPVPIVYYYFVEPGGKPAPAGSVVVFEDTYILGPTLSDKARSPDPVTNISSALQAMLNDPRNAWTSKDVGITGITFDDGDAHVALEGEYFSVGDVTLIAAREQIALTVFAEGSVQTAIITFNGKNIANMGISHSSQAKPEDYTYTRAEIEAFMVENAYEAP